MKSPCPTIVLVQSEDQRVQNVLLYLFRQTKKKQKTNNKLNAIIISWCFIKFLFWKLRDIPRKFVQDHSRINFCYLPRKIWIQNQQTKWPGCVLQRAVLKSFFKIYKKRSWRSLLLNKKAGSTTCNFTKNRLRSRFSLWILGNFCEQLLTEHS